MTLRCQIGKNIIRADGSELLAVVSKPEVRLERVGQR